MYYVDQVIVKVDASEVPPELLEPPKPVVPKVPRPRTRPRKVICEVCHRAFRYYCELKVHYNSHAGNGPFNQFQCDCCEKVYTNPHSLSNHKKIHVGKRPFTCQYCGKSFFYKHVLVDHEKTHTKDKPHKC